MTTNRFSDVCLVLSIFFASTLGAQVPGNPDEMASLEKKSLAMIDAGTPERAHRAALLIVEGKRRQLRDQLFDQDETGRLRLLTDLRPYDVAASVEAGPAIAEAVLMAKGVVLESLLEETRSVRASQRQILERLQQRILSAREELAAAPVGSSSNHPKWKLESLEMFARCVGDVGDTQRSISTTAAEVKAKLPAQMALIEYFRYNRYLGRGEWEATYGAVILRQGKEPIFVKLSPAEQIENEIRNYRRSIEIVAEGQIDNRAVEQGSRSLFQKCFGGLRPYLVGITQLIISPDGLLNFLPFGALLDEQGRFLAEAGDFYYVGSGRDLIARGSMGAWVKSPALIVGDPNFAAVQEEPDSPKRFDGIDGGSPLFKGVVFSPLPGTRQETLSISRALGTGTRAGRGVITRLGDDATERAIRSVRSPEILHLATHGFFLQDSDAESGVNPMLRSGLALSGAQSTIDRWRNGESRNPLNDGILFAAEIGLLDLTGTELVTLSACQTGLGEQIPGEGVMGMRRAFAMAGARNVLMTLWDIADEPTAAFMSDFYTRYKETGHAPRTLAETQRQWLVRLRNEKGLAVATYLAGPFVMSAQTPRHPVNSLGMSFVEVPGTDVLMSIWETRMRDYAFNAADDAGLRMNWAYDERLDQPDLPAEGMDWYEAKAFCDWLSKKEGVTYRLPTDHEWSLAVGIGRGEDANASPRSKHLKIRDVFPWGSEWPPPVGSGNFKNSRSNSPFPENDPFQGIAPVGSFTPNALGIYDLGGNVWEWCEDVEEPGSLLRVRRGGQSIDNPGELMSSFRDFRGPRVGGDGYGFRIVMVRDSGNRVPDQ